MMRSMYSGVAGLRTHQTRMDVIGNNIANVNTVGYKAQAALFADLLYQNSSSASGPNETTNLGGVNAKQVGLGAKMASISTNITLPGSAETTNNPFDIMITGSSFFIVNNGRENMFTRDGSFKVDAAGNLVLSSNGYKVMGWQPDPTTGKIKPDTVSALTIMSAANMTYPPEATTLAYVSGIIDSDSPEVNSDDGKIMNLNFFDKRGYSYTAKLAIKKGGDTDNEHVFSCELVGLLDSTGKDITAETGAKLGSPEVVKLPAEISTGLVNNNYAIEKVNDTTYKIKNSVDAKEYTIQDTNTGVQITGSDVTDTANPKPITDEAQLWKDVATAFGYGDDVDKFKNFTSDIPDPANPDATITVSVDENLASIMAASGMANGTGTAAGKISFTGRTVEGSSISFNKSDGQFAGVGASADGTVKLQFGTTNETVQNATNFEEISIDFSTLTNLGNEKVTTASATNGSLQNQGGGRKVGKMSGVMIQNDGKIYCTYDNGQSKLVGQIAAASFANPSGLQKEGDNLYIATQNSGDFDGIGIDITSDGGYMTTGELEMSNVDLSGELTGMIVTQRGFQANSRIITVSDTMLEELINLKR